MYFVCKKYKEQQTNKESIDKFKFTQNMRSMSLQSTNALNGNDSNDESEDMYKKINITKKESEGIYNKEESEGDDDELYKEYKEIIVTTTYDGTTTKENID